MNSNMTNIAYMHIAFPFSASLEDVELVETKLWKVWLKNIRALGTVTPIADVCLNVRNLF